MSRRLTSDERRFRELTESQFQRQVTSLAQMLGWHWVHVSYGPKLNRAGAVVRYTTPTTGTMAQGWPDLVLVRPKDSRLIFAELKRETGKTSPEQDTVLDILRSLSPMVEVYVWRPSEVDEIARILA